MRRFGVTLLSAWALRAVSCNSCPANCDSPDGLFQELKNSLSPAASIYLRGSKDFEAKTARWSELDTPTANIVVIPATEDDVVDTDGKTATIGGGASSKTVTDALWESGKQTVTGTCECVSYIGPALGGGHGFSLQGHHGLITDQSVSMNVVLGDGSLQTINSSSDLWWAIKGAGQNFAIVTSVTAEIYDIEYRDWAIETLIFSGDKVEAVYEASNQHLANLPVDIINWSYWPNIPDADPDKLIILFYIIQEGVTVVDPACTSPFRNIGPISSEAKSGSYRDLAAWTEIAADSIPCQKAVLANPRFPIYLREYDVAAQRDAYDTFVANVGAANSSFSASIFMFEAYSQQGVRATQSDSTAFAFRNDNLLAAPLLTYKPADKELDHQAARIGNELRDIIYRGSGHEELHVYVNYAYGKEKPENWYGYERWRRVRLGELKRKYDPEGRFNFFAPSLPLDRRMARMDVY